MTISKHSIINKLSRQAPATLARRGLKQAHGEFQAHPGNRVSKAAPLETDKQKSPNKQESRTFNLEMLFHHL